MDRRQTDQEGAFRERLRQLGPLRSIKHGSPFKRVLLRRIVVHGGHSADFADLLHRRQYGIALSRMKVSARWIGAQGPRGITRLLPRRQRQCVPKKERNRLQRQRHSRHACARIRAGIELPIGQRAACFRQREANQIRSRVAPKRIRLRRPIHGAERGGVAVVVVFCPLVVGDNHLFGRGRCFAAQLSKGHDEQLIYDNPATSKNSDGLGL